MIKNLLLSTIVFLTICTSISKAQTRAEADSIQRAYANKKAKNLFFEILGPGMAYSVNYDTRFKNRQDGLGGRVGISYIADDNTSIFTIPVVANYLLGKRGKYFEIGAGATFYHYTSNTNGFLFLERDYISNGNGYYEDEAKSGVFGTLNFGYRYQPIDGGFSFRGGFSPIFNSHQFVPYWPYLSFGYTF